MLIPVILSGGAGTRLWPVSRLGHPKPFMKLADDQSLPHKTYQRAASATDGPEIATVTNRDYYFMSKDEFAGAGVESHRSATFLLEPMGRNTAPAIALVFNATVVATAALACDDYLVTFGIVPTAPETGFGYIECAAESCWQTMSSGNGAQTGMREIPADSFAKVPDISIDYAVIEKVAQPTPEQASTSNGKLAVVSGMARIINGEREIMVSANESTYIPAGHKHRLENPSVLDLVMIEVQSGEYLGEDDIVRFDDVYGRC